MKYTMMAMLLLLSAIVVVHAAPPRKHRPYHKELEGYSTRDLDQVDGGRLPYDDDVSDKFDPRVDDDDALPPSAFGSFHRYGDDDVDYDVGSFHRHVDDTADDDAYMARQESMKRTGGGFDDFDSPQWRSHPIELDDEDDEPYY